MRIGLDARSLNTPHLRGMGKALFAVLEAADAAFDDVEFVLFADEPRHPLIHPASRRISSQVWEVRGHRFRAWEQYGLPRAAVRSGCDVLHAFGTWAPWWQPLPTVVTIHDTIPWQASEPQQHADEKATLLLDVVQPRAYRKARAILTPSENSRRDILERWPELAPRTQVVSWGIGRAYLAADLPSSDLERLHPQLREPYLLYFGGHLDRKRLGWAVEVWRRASPETVQLAVCGLPEDVVAKVVQQVPANCRDRFVPLPFVDEAALPGLYARSLGVLYPTLYEGFGFPALEAQAVGRPILLSAVSSLQELVGPSAVVLPPHDLDAWVTACRRITTARQDCDQEARRWASRFSWQATAARLVEAYRAACGRRVPSA